MSVQTHLNRWQPWILSILVGLIPLSFSIDLQMKALPAAMLFLIGLALLICSREVRANYRHAWLMTVPSLAMVIFAILNVIGHRLGWKPLDHAAHIVLYLVIAATFSQSLRLRLIWAMFSATAVVFGTICMVQHSALGLTRAHSLNGGASSAIEFAMIMLGLALIGSVQLLRSEAGNAERMLHGAGMLFGMYGALLTQSRGPLLAFVPAFLGVLLLQTWHTGRWRRSALLAVAICGGGVLATMTVHSGVVDRFAAINQELSVLPAERSADKSINERLEMWRTASRAIASHPWVGIGIDQFDTYAREEVIAGRSDPAIGQFNHPHNEYLEATTGGGLPGLLVLLAMFAMPTCYFLRYARHPDEAIAMTAATGLVVIVLYVLCGITDSVFYRVMSQSFYFLLVPSCAILIARLVRQPEIRRATEPAAS